MKVEFVKDCGHHIKGTIVECESANGAQYVNGGFAEFYNEPKPEPKPEAKSPLSKKMLDALVAGGYEELDDILNASDKELLAIKGIGKAAVKQIREL